MRSYKSYDNFRFSRYTTYGLGGGAEAAYFPKTAEEACDIYDFVKKTYEKFIILGNGSNILAANSGFGGAVICTKRLSGISCDGEILRCLGGTTVQTLLNYCLEKGLCGLEYLAGIPASVGGLAVMNGGVNSRHVSDDVQCIELYDGKKRILIQEECDFANKHSIMRDTNGIVTGVTFKVRRSTREIVEKNIEGYLRLRKLQPKGRSCGCVFKNHEGYGAGKLIDEAGLKGLKIGSAEVSRDHANFIISRGDSSDDVYALIGEVKRRVKCCFGVNLEEEVVYIGEFNDFNC